jgi:hypothetical protein
LKDIDPLLKVSIENNILEQYINHPLYDDELKNTLEEDIHNIMIQQNDIEKQYGYENIEIESMLCNTCMISYVTKKTKSLESMNTRFKFMIWMPS